jgi:hypothetical protein
MTSVVGIFILMILIMVLQLANSIESSRRTAAVDIDRELLNTVDLLQREVSRLQAEYDTLQRNQAEAADINVFNKEQKLKELQLERQELDDRLSKSHENIGALSKAIIESKRIHQEVLAQAEACESDRNEIERMLKKREEIERFATILDTDHPVVYRDKTAEGRHLVIICLEQGSIFVSDAGADVSQAFKGVQRLRQLKSWLDATQLDNRQILLMVKPSGVRDYDEVVLILDQSGAAYGFDVAAEESKFLLRSQLEVGG